MKDRLQRAFFAAVLLSTLGAYLEVGFAQRSEGFRYRATASVTFDHSKHTDQACETCHAAAPASVSAADDLGPSMQVCAACHATQAPQMHQCSECHAGTPDAAVGTPPEAAALKPFVARRPKPDIRFSHKKHLATPCVTCHVSPNPTLPPMSTCTSCHAATGAPTDCGACHTTPVSAQPSLRPDSHTADWLARHGSMALAKSDDCMACHQEADCVTCHSAQLAKPYAIHPPNFVTIHAVDARADTATCTTCHSVENFCTACHVRANVTTRLDARPPSTRQFHPPGFADGRTPDNHGVMARRNIVECASCHTQNDCVTCHTAINPHPVDFRFECRKWLEANPTPCAKCHEDPSGLRGRCL